MSWVIFFLASTASFLPIYRALTRLTARGASRPGRHVDQPAGSPDRKLFIDSLRWEAIARVDAALVQATGIGATAAATGTTDAAPRDAATLARIGEARRTVETLFPGDTAAAFDNAIAVLKRPTTQRPEAAAVIADLRARLTRQVSQASRAGELRAAA